MQRRSVVALLIAASSIAFAPQSLAQSAKSLAGTYSGVSFSVTDGAGKTTQVFGENPRAMLVLTADGHYSAIVMRASLPKFTSNSRLKGTPEENKAVIDGSIAHFGRYTIDEKDKTITFHVESSTYPNWDGAPQKRPFTVKGDQLSYTVPTSSTGPGSAEVIWKRMKPAL